MSIKVTPYILILTLLLSSLTVLGQQDQYRYLVLFKDKANSPYSINKPNSFLSSKSVERRTKLNIALTEQDLPVNPAYLDQIRTTGATVLFPLKWINGAIIQQKPKDLAKTLKSPSVKGLYWNFPADSSAKLKITSSVLSTQAVQSVNASDASIDYGNSLTQISQIGVDIMHAKGFHGENVLISLLDNGYLNANIATFLQKIYSENRLVGTLTTSPGLSSVYQGGSHGTEVLSAIAGQYPGKLYGTAYQAKIAIAQTEEEDTELIVEEANWLRAAEWADSLGTDIISSSLGYSEFDNTKQNHTYADMNGKNTLVSNAAHWAAHRGIICVISAGNEGSGTWKYITAPADADSILAVGAVDRTGLRGSFSSQGPTFDKRIKPDISAMGLGTIVGLPSGLISSLNGTSFSAPLVAGLAAGLIQSNPTKNNFQVIDALRRSGNQQDKPDNFLGWGIPNFDRAFNLLNTVLGTEESKEPLVEIFPNPLRTGQKLTIHIDYSLPISMEICNSQGAVMMKHILNSAQEEVYLPPLASGKYFVRFTLGGIQKVIPLLYNLGE